MAKRIRTLLATADLSFVIVLGYQLGAVKLFSDPAKKEECKHLVTVLGNFRAMKISKLTILVVGYISRLHFY